MPLVTEGWSDPMKDANKLTPLLRSDDLIQVEKARFRKMIVNLGRDVLSKKKREETWSLSQK